VAPSSTPTKSPNRNNSNSKKGNKQQPQRNDETPKKVNANKRIPTPSSSSRRSGKDDKPSTPLRRQSSNNNGHVKKSPLPIIANSNTNLIAAATSVSANAIKNDTQNDIPSSMTISDLDNLVTSPAVTYGSISSMNMDASPKSAAITTPLFSSQLSVISVVTPTVIPVVDEVPAAPSLPVSVPPSPSATTIAPIVTTPALVSAASSAAASPTRKRARSPSPSKAAATSSSSSSRGITVRIPTASPPEPLKKETVKAAVSQRSLKNNEKRLRPSTRTTSIAKVGVVNGTSTTSALLSGRDSDTRSIVDLSRRIVDQREALQRAHRHNNTDNKNDESDRISSLITITDVARSSYHSYPHGYHRDYVSIPVPSKLVPSKSSVFISEQPALKNYFTSYIKNMNVSSSSSQASISTSAAAAPLKVSRSPMELSAYERESRRLEANLELERTRAEKHHSFLLQQVCFTTFMSI
jgi:hypothetical protein